MKSTLNININLPTPKVETILTEVVSKNLKETKMEISGVEVTLEMNGKITLRGNKNIISYQLPLDIHILRPSGLFTVEGQGKVNMTFQSEINFDKSLNIHSKTDLLDHDWLERPKLKLGSLSMPVETLINMIIKHSESILIGKIDEAVKENISIRGMIENEFFSFVKNNELVINFDLGADIVLDKLDFNKITIDPEKFNINAQIEGYTNIGNHRSNLVLPQVAFSDVQTESSNFKSQIKLTYNQIKSLINEFTPNMEVAGKNLEFYIKDIFYAEKLNIAAIVEQPAKMQVAISGTPVIGEDSLLDFENLDLVIKPTSIIYKLFVPVIKGMLESRMAEYFPINLNLFLSKLPYPPIKKSKDLRFNTTWEKMIIDEVRFETTGINIALSEKELSLNITS